jgi:hypothetical protein
MFDRIIPKRASKRTLVIAIFITLLVIFLIWRSFSGTRMSIGIPMPIEELYTEPYTRYAVGPKNGNAAVSFDSRSTYSDQYGVYLYQITGLTQPSRNKNVMKYVGGGPVGSPFSGQSGSFGWMIGVVKPTALDGFKIDLKFDKKITLFDGEVVGPLNINSLNTHSTNSPNGRVYIKDNVVRLNFKSNEPQIMLSLKYV